MAKEEKHVDIVEKNKFNRQKASSETYGKNTKKGFLFKDAKSGKSALRSENHHILPVEALQDPNIKPQSHLEFINQCMAITKWDINESPNMHGLPTKKPLEDADRYSSPLPLSFTDSAKLALSKKAIRDAAAGKFGALPNLPCHKFEHPSYSTEVMNYLKKRVWEPLCEGIKPCEVNPKNLRKALNGASKRWRGWLVERGEEGKGAAYCWINRWDDPAIEHTWYRPLSMAPEPRACPRPTKLPPKQQKTWLNNIFKAIST